MKAIIGRFYKNLKDARKEQERNKKLWKGRIAWYIISYPNGHLVVSESATRACFPDLKLSYKDRRFGKLPSKLQK